MRYFRATLGMLRAEFFHELDERLDALERHRVADRSAHAPDRAMPLELRKSPRLGPFQEFRIEGGVAQAERNVHARAVFPGDRIRVEILGVEIAVEEAALADIG